MTVTPTFFKTPQDFRRWLDKHHASTDELWVGFYKRESGKPSITWPESVDEALCVGWIDGVRKRHGPDSYMIRFTPRRRRSVWSVINIRKVEMLTAQGRMRPAGVKAYAARQENRSGTYSYEQRRDQLEEPYASALKSHIRAWEFFQSQPASYRKVAGWWVVSAKKEETRAKRLQKLIDYCEQGKRIV